MAPQKTQQKAHSLRSECKHRYPTMVMAVEGGLRRAQCMNCDALGEIRETIGEAISALRMVR
jgi:hypothetical protein